MSILITTFVSKIDIVDILIKNNVNISPGYNVSNLLQNNKSCKFLFKTTETTETTEFNLLAYKLEER